MTSASRTSIPITLCPRDSKRSLVARPIPDAEPVRAYVLVLLDMAGISQVISLRLKMGESDARHKRVHAPHIPDILSLKAFLPGDSVVPLAQLARILALECLHLPYDDFGVIA